jgi:hypothetical protein
MMANYIKQTEYWQVRATGEIMEVPPAERSLEWMKAYRQVRCFHHAESDCVFLEDYHAPAYVLQNHFENQAEEVDLATYRLWKMIYDNPDI